MSKKDYNETIQDVSNDVEEIKKLGGKDNIKKYKKKQKVNEIQNHRMIIYINYLKTTVINCYEKYEYEKNFRVELKRKY